MLDIRPRDEGVAGAHVAINDNNTTGKFLGQSFTLDATETKFDADVVPVFKEMLARGDRFILADISAKQLLSIADIAKENGALLFDVGATDDILREEECRPNVLPHGANTYHARRRPGAISGLETVAQTWVLLYGSHERDQLYAEAIRRAATRFGATIVEERLYEDKGTARRTDTGVIQVQKQMPVFTQNLPEHDVIVVADESEVFGETMSRTAHGHRGLSQEQQGSFLRAGILRASNGRDRKSRTVSTRQPDGECYRRTCRPGSRYAYWERP